MAEPSLILLQGDDSIRVKELLAGYVAALGDESMAQLNTTRLNGEGLSLEALAADAGTMPFLAERRLIIVENARPWLGKFKKEEQEKVLALFEGLPETTLLVLQVEDGLVRKGRERFWEHQKSYEWLLKWVEAHKALARVEICTLPDESEMGAWILRQAKARQGAFRPDAARLLAAYVGNDTRRALLEVDKLLIYAGPSRQVEPADVMLLTAQEQEGNIFEFTDALGERNGGKAMRQFRLLSDASDIVELAPMIHRQFRLLIQAREIKDEGGRAADIQKQLGVLPFIAEKLNTQANRFTMPQLVGIYQRLVDIDEAMKTGGMPGDVAFELLIADLTR